MRVKATDLLNDGTVALYKTPVTKCSDTIFRSRRSREIAVPIQ